MGMASGQVLEDAVRAAIQGVWQASSVPWGSAMVSLMLKASSSERLLRSARCGW